MNGPRPCLSRAEADRLRRSWMMTLDADFVAQEFGVSRRTVYRYVGAIGHCRECGSPFYRRSDVVDHVFEPAEPGERGALLHERWLVDVAESGKATTAEPLASMPAPPMPVPPMPGAPFGVRRIPSASSPAQYIGLKGQLPPPRTSRRTEPTEADLEAVRAAIARAADAAAADQERARRPFGIAPRELHITAPNAPYRVGDGRR